MGLGLLSVVSSQRELVCLEGVYCFPSGICVLMYIEISDYVQLFSTVTVQD